MKLNLGCGEQKLEGYISVDLHNPAADVQADMSKLPYEDETIDEIYASHIIEHADYYQAKEWLTEWKRVLKTGGILILETPDFLESCKKFALLPEDQQYTMYGHFFAKAHVPGEIHKFLYTKREIWGQLASVGFSEIQFEEPTMHIQNPNIRVRCNKI